MTSVRSSTDSAATAAAISADGRVNPGAVGRTRGVRPATGVAVARPPYSSDVRYVSFPFYGPWGYYYPWYGYGFNYGYGYGYYNPWMYSGTHWIYGRYGYWYDPFAYDPFAYGAYSVDPGYGGGSGGGGGGHNDTYEPRMGSIRFRVDPKGAQIYIDGALVGTVDEFDGLSSHLEIEAGSHELRLKAPGYEIYTATIDVPASRTTTHRIKMKKQ